MGHPNGVIELNSMDRKKDAPNHLASRKFRALAHIVEWLVNTVLGDHNLSM
jgi:hypothetical protein